MNLPPHTDVIDATARAMTLEDPPGALRARVLAKLPPRQAPWALRFALPMGAAAALAIAWMIVDPTASVRPAHSAVREAVAHVDTHLQASPDAVLAEPPATTVLRVLSDASMSQEDLAWHSRAVAPLPAFAPIELSAIQPAALSIAPITVDPIVPGPIPNAPDGGRQ